MKYSVLILLLVILFSCHNTKKEDEKVSDTGVIEILKILAPEKDFSAKLFVLIVPFDGCSSCFEAALSLISEVSNKSHLIIIPDLYKRRVENFINDFGLTENFVAIDTLRLTIKNNLVESNPLIIVIENNKVIFSEAVEIGNMARIEKKIRE